jgi:hypothetical protein
MNIRIGRGKSVHAPAGSTRHALCGGDLTRGTRGISGITTTSEDVTCKRCLKTLISDAHSEAILEDSDRREAVAHAAAARVARTLSEAELAQAVKLANGGSVRAIYQVELRRRAEHKANQHVEALQADEIRTEYIEMLGELGDLEVGARLHELSALRNASWDVQERVLLCRLELARRWARHFGTRSVGDSLDLEARRQREGRIEFSSYRAGLVQIMRDELHAQALKDRRADEMDRLDAAHAFKGPYQGCTVDGCDLPRESGRHAQPLRGRG